jgi:hypothetical protein
LIRVLYKVHRGGISEQYLVVGLSEAIFENSLVPQHGSEININPSTSKDWPLKDGRQPGTAEEEPVRFPKPYYDCNKCTKFELSRISALIASSILAESFSNADGHRRAASLTIEIASRFSHVVAQRGTMADNCMQDDRSTQEQ